MLRGNGNPRWSRTCWHIHIKCVYACGVVDCSAASSSHPICIRSYDLKVKCQVNHSGELWSEMPFLYGVVWTASHHGVSHLLFLRNKNSSHNKNKIYQDITAQDLAVDAQYHTSLRANPQLIKSFYKGWEPDEEGNLQRPQLPLDTVHHHYKDQF